MRILLFGKNGQIGRELQRTLLPLGEVDARGRQEVDLEDVDRLQETLRQCAPAVIVNAAAYTSVDAAESDEESAYRVNAEAVGVMASHAAASAALLVHYSTDYVFDGEKPGAYVEFDATNPQNVYGRSKRAGEEAIRRSGCNALVLRTSWVYSVHGTNFVKTILRLAREKSRIEVVADQHGAPTSAELIADVTTLAIFARKKGHIPAGTFHLAASGETSRHGLACHVVAQALARGIALTLRPQDICAVSSETLRLPAKRPANSRLNTSALANALELHLPDWKVHVDRAVEQFARDAARI